MADAYFIVTLSSADAGSGPNYNVLYSTDCISYSAANPATITLNNVGSQAYITVPDTAQCIKLTNINSNCTNSVTSSLTITTTTTTTAAPTTTTTLAPTTTTTTTTTTTAAPSVYQWDASVTNFTDHSASCALPFTTTYYTSTNFLYLNTTIIYLDAGLTTTLNGGNGFVKMSRAGVTNVYSVRVNSSGLVTRLTVCPSTTTTTTTTTTAP